MAKSYSLSAKKKKEVDTKRKRKKMEEMLGLNLVLSKINSIN